MEPIAPWEPPDYADPEQFDEQDVTVGSGPLAVPGTLSLPRHDDPRPGVVLLSGSGPQDRDETIGRSKPLKDLAWGLASRGVVVLRFDKVTYAHGSEIGPDRDFTVAGEYIRDAAADTQRRNSTARRALLALVAVPMLDFFPTALTPIPRSPRWA